MYMYIYIPRVIPPPTLYTYAPKELVFTSYISSFHHFFFSKCACIDSGYSV